MLQAKGKIIYALKSALKTSCYAQMFCRIGCGNHRAMYEPAAGVWRKKKKVHCSDSSTPVLPKYQFQEGCQEHISHHTIPICSLNQIKRAHWKFRAKSSSHRSSQWEMLKKGKELMWGGGEMGEETRSCQKCSLGDFLEQWTIHLDLCNVWYVLHLLQTAVTLKTCTRGSNQYHHVLVPPWHYACCCWTPQSAYLGLKLPHFPGFVCSPSYWGVNVAKNKHSEDFSFCLGRQQWIFCKLASSLPTMRCLILGAQQVIKWRPHQAHGY